METRSSLGRRCWTVGVAVGTALVVISTGLAWANLPLPVPDPAKLADPPAVVPAEGGRMGASAAVASVNDLGGSQYEIPLEVVPGRGGFQPELCDGQQGRATVDAAGEPQ